LSSLCTNTGLPTIAPSKPCDPGTSRWQPKMSLIQQTTPVEEPPKATAETDLVTCVILAERCNPLMREHSVCCVSGELDLQRLLVCRYHFPVFFGAQTRYRYHGNYLVEEALSREHPLYQDPGYGTWLNELRERTRPAKRAEIDRIVLVRLLRYNEEENETRCDDPKIDTGAADAGFPSASSERKHASSASPAGPADGSPVDVADQTRWARIIQARAAAAATLPVSATSSSTYCRAEHHRKGA